MLDVSSSKKMHFLTKEQCSDWFPSHQFKLADSALPTRPDADDHFCKIWIPKPFDQVVSFCAHLELALAPREELLLWVTDWGIWHEERHLYYRLRQSYGDLRRLHEAPGHLFLDYESADIRSFLQVILLLGWDVNLIPRNGFARAFVSHDGYALFSADSSNGALVEEFEKPYKENPG